MEIQTKIDIQIRATQTKHPYETSTNIIFSLLCDIIHGVPFALMLNSHPAYDKKTAVKMTKNSLIYF